MARDDLHDTDDLIRIIEEEVPHTVLNSGLRLGAPAITSRGPNQHFNTARIAARSELQNGLVLDIDLIQNGSAKAIQLDDRLRKAAEKAENLARFRPPPAPEGVRITQTTRIEPAR